VHARVFVILAVLVLAGLSTGCGTGNTDGGTFPNAATLVQVLITPSNATVQSPGTVQFAATAVYSDGTSAPAVFTAVTWSSSSTSVATISSNGLATGGSVPVVPTFSTVISATYLGVTGITNLTVTPATGTVQEFSNGITTGAQPGGIARGDDGNLWFTDFTGNRVGFITTAGAVTLFSSGITAGANPAGIAAGSDGNLWFTEFTGNRIGRITTAGVVTEFSTGITAGSQPSGITSGPDGNLWFTESAGNRIGVIVP